MPLLFLFSKAMEKFIKSFQNMSLFDYTTGHFVKKCDLSDEMKKKYQEHADAHFKMMNERLKNK